MTEAAARLVDCLTLAASVKFVNFVTKSAKSVDYLTGAAVGLADCVTGAASVELALILAQITIHTKSPVR